MEKIVKEKLLDEIKQIEIDLSKEDSSVTIRSFVEYFNTKYPNHKIIENSILKELFQEFYNNNAMHSRLQDSLLKRFYKNDGVTSYINPHEINIIPIPLNLDNNENHFKKIHHSFDNIEKSLALIERKGILNSIYKLEEEHKRIKVIDVFSITGASKVKEKFREARKIYYNYKSLIDGYETIKLELQILFSDFEKIRNILKFLREDLMNMLIEIYGENVKATHPDFFSFDSVKWMDFEEIIDNLNTDFYTIEENCKTFFSSHRETMSELSNSAMNRLDKMNGQKGALRNAAIDIGIDALISISKTNQNANMTIADLDYEIELMKASFWNDSKKIRLDIMRLLEIHKNLKDYLVPATKLFTNGFYKIFENEIKKDFNSIFSLELIKPIKDQNIKLSLELRKLDIEIHDLTIITNESKNLKTICESNVNYYQNDYDFAMINEPKMPSRLTIILSLGTSVNIFYKMHNQWDRKTSYVRNEYNYNLNKEQVESERESVHQILIDKAMQKKSNLKIEILQNSKKINDFLNTENEIKNQVSANFKKIASLSQAAKNVLEIRLDQKLIETVELNF